MSNYEQYRYIDSLTLGNKLRRLVWNFVWLIAFRPTPRWALHGWRRTLLRMFGAKVGKGSKVSPSCKVWAPWNLEMGDFSVLGDDVDCYSMNKVIIGSKVAVSQRTFLCTGSHEINSLLRPLITAPIKIGNHVWIAAECFIHPGLSIGEGAVVGARSVVTRDMPEWQVCVGVPCRPIKVREINDEKKL